MLIETIAFFLGVSILLYALLAGADFGAGILEAFTGKANAKEQRELITHAMGPVWEANHVWLILAIVILFVGFPKAYSQMSISFHIPLTIMLIGIILRGCAFTFRHYDAVQDESQKYYSLIFVISSFLTPFMLGTVAGALLLGRATVETLDFYTVYISPWFNLFSVSIGIFTCILFAFLAAVYLIGETQVVKLKQIFIRRARRLNLLAVAAGLLVFAAAHLDGLDLAAMFFSHPIAIVAMALTTLLLAPLWQSIRSGWTQTARVLVASQVALILIGWFSLQFPTLLDLDAAEAITIYNSAAPDPTLRFLLYALIAGLALVIPALAYLFKIFKATDVH